MASSVASSTTPPRARPDDFRARKPINPLIPSHPNDASHDDDDDDDDDRDDDDIYYTPTSRTASNASAPNRVRV